MSIKTSAVTLYLKLINQWMEALKHADKTTLRFIRGNFKTIIQVASRSRYGSIVGISRTFHLHIPNQPISELATRGNIECSWTGEQFESPTEDGSYCVMTTLRAITFRRLLELLDTYHLHPSSTRALIIFEDTHHAHQTVGKTITWVRGDEQDERRHLLFVLTKSKSEGKKARIELTQAASYARKVDGRPIIPAGMHILAELQPRRD